MLKFSIISVICGIFFIVCGFFIKDSKIALNASALGESLANFTAQKAAKPCLYVKASSLNVRESPNINAKILNSLSKNTEICDYLAVQNGFLETENGFIAAQYLGFTKDNDLQKPAIPTFRDSPSSIISSTSPNSMTYISLNPAQNQATIQDFKDMPQFEIKDTLKDSKDSKAQFRVSKENAIASRKVSSTNARIAQLSDNYNRDFDTKAQNQAVFSNAIKDSRTKTSANKKKPKFLLTSAQKQDNKQEARIALESKDYTLAKDLALRVNKRNPKDLDSWEIFARSLYLEGNAQEAIFILQNFLRENYDANLMQLLDKMQKGLEI